MVHCICKIIFKGLWFKLWWNRWYDIQVLLLWTWTGTMTSGTWMLTSLTMAIRGMMAIRFSLLKLCIFTFHYFGRFFCFSILFSILFFHPPSILPTSWSLFDNSKYCFSFTNLFSKAIWNRYFMMSFLLMACTIISLLFSILA